MEKKLHFNVNIIWHLTNLKFLFGNASLSPKTLNVGLTFSISFALSLFLVNSAILWREVNPLHDDILQLNLHIVSARRRRNIESLDATFMQFGHHIFGEHVVDITN